MDSFKWEGIKKDMKKGIVKIWKFLKSASGSVLRYVGLTMRDALKMNWKALIYSVLRYVGLTIRDAIYGTITKITPIVVLFLIGLYCNQPILNKAIEVQENYIEKMLNFSLDTKIIHSLTGVHFHSKILYDSLKARANEKSIDEEYQKFEKSFKKWETHFDENLDFIKSNISKKNIKKKKCFNEFVSESECLLRKINKGFSDWYQKLKSCYESQKMQKSCDYTISDFNHSFRTPIDNKIIQFYKKFQEERKKEKLF